MISPKSSSPRRSSAGIEPATYGLRNQSANQCTTGVTYGIGHSSTSKPKYIYIIYI